ncbi:hypothetical protein D9X30_4374 [Cupriavidus sp. U2]|uniref:hypothetical protein n=1 Tax=Cupriavidus sp. U2 TaxID=2920269 RepID=UPI001E307B9E|nr:hypothetical protein [Cupriavidus sp. U2]KAI3590889.1 hypothetical protein D9X30_4374 [Cupriavidus sp. U2]
MPNAMKPLQCLIVATGALSLCLGAMPAQAQQMPSSGAAAISDAVREGGNPYRAPSAPSASPADAKRERCDALLQELSGTSKQRAYTSPGTATQSAQGRAVPKLERDNSRKQLEETYRANCT